MMKSTVFAMRGVSWGDPDYVDEILTPFDEEPSSRGFEDGEGGPDRCTCCMISA